MAGQLLERGGDQCDGQHQLVHDAAGLHRQQRGQVEESQGAGVHVCQGGGGQHQEQGAGVEEVVGDAENPGGDSCVGLGSGDVSRGK